MPFGDTAKKLQQVANVAEDLYEKMNELREQLKRLREDAERTTEQIEDMDHELTEHRAILEALADEQGIDAEAVIADRVDDPEPGITAKTDTANDDSSPGPDGTPESSDGSPTGPAPDDGADGSSR